MVETKKFFMNGENMGEQKIEQSEELKKALAERDTFLEKNPSLRVFQEQIDNMLKSTKDPTERLRILFRMIAMRNKEIEEIINEYKIEYNILPKTIKENINFKIPGIIQEYPITPKVF